MNRVRSVKRDARKPAAVPTLLFSSALLLAALAASAQTAPDQTGTAAAISSGPGSVSDATQAFLAVAPHEYPRLSLNAIATREVTQDRVAVTVSTSIEAPEPGPAQAQVNERLNPVLARLKERKELDVKSAGYRSDPIWKDSRIVGWRARGALMITGAPSESINKLVGELANILNVESVSYFLSREARLNVEQELIADAISAFRSKAQAAAQAFGYRNWIVHEVVVGDSGGEPGPEPKMMMARAAATDAAPMPMAEGRSTVSVTVGGSVVLVAK